MDTFLWEVNLLGFVFGWTRFPVPCLCGWTHLWGGRLFVLNPYRSAR